MSNFLIPTIDWEGIWTFEDTVCNLAEIVCSTMYAFCIRVWTGLTRPTAFSSNNLPIRSCNLTLASCKANYMVGQKTAGLVAKVGHVGSSDSCLSQRGNLFKMYLHNQANIFPQPCILPTRCSLDLEDFNDWIFRERHLRPLRRSRRRRSTPTFLRRPLPLEAKMRATTTLHQMGMELRYVFFYILN